jgi:cytochrome c5
MRNPTDTAMSHRSIVILAALVATSLPLLSAGDRKGPRDGKQVYSDVCASCHAQGRDGAPRVGDAKAWARLSERGLSSLGDSAIAGVRKMPPHGGKLETTDLEIKRAITYMVNESGGKWVEPADRTRAAMPRTGEEIVKARCSECHQTGRNGAPAIGDNKAWVNRAKAGYDGLVQSALRGHGGMPARGGMAELTDSEVKSAVAYMVETSLRQPAK